MLPGTHVRTGVRRFQTATPAASMARVIPASVVTPTEAMENRFASTR